VQIFENSGTNFLLQSTSKISELDFADKFAEGKPKTPDTSEIQIFEVAFVKS
jgi:hypothetical protein